jgi:hypothetical protein
VNKSIAIFNAYNYLTVILKMSFVQLSSKKSLLLCRHLPTFAVLSQSTGVVTCCEKIETGMFSRVIFKQREKA